MIKQFLSPHLHLETDWLLSETLLGAKKSPPLPKYLLYLKHTSTVTRGEAWSNKIYTVNSKWNWFILMEEQNLSFKNSLFLQKIYCSTSPHKTVVRKKLVHVISLWNKLSVVEVNHEEALFFSLTTLNSSVIIHTLGRSHCFPSHL